MSSGLLIVLGISYIILLFTIAYVAERIQDSGTTLTSHPLIYALSIAVYCTAWTFFGSIGKASTSGITFLPIYIGPTLCCILWWFVLRKMIYISKAQRITSIADFVSARYGKSIILGVLATVVAIFTIIPYISIQLKAVAVSYSLLIYRNLEGWFEGSIQDIPFYYDSAWYITIVMALFAILFGTRRLDPIERHEGMVVAIAFESIFKLIAFILGGVFVTYYLFDGFGDILQQAYQNEDLRSTLTLEGQQLEGTSWFFLCLLSAFAIILLPRQFHIAVVENSNPNYVAQAAWIFPLYLFIINLFVLPIAMGGRLLLGENANPDTYILSLPLSQSDEFIALFIALGGFSAAIGMVVVAVTALSIMISNSLMSPLLLRSSTIQDKRINDLSDRLLNIRRISVVVVLILAYSYFKFISSQYALVSIGLISFAGIAQFAPAVFGGMYWKRATRKGAITGLLSGFIVWGFCLPYPNLAEVGLISPELFQTGFMGIELLNPYQLFGLKGWDPISHGTFWSLFINTTVFVGVSMFTRQSTIEVIQADFFVNNRKYRKGAKDYDLIRRSAKVSDIIVLINRFLGEQRANQIIQDYEAQYRVDLSKKIIADESFIHRAEIHLTGAIGAASAKIMLNSIVKAEPVQLEEMFQILDQTQEIIQYSKQLEAKSAELVATTEQLRKANEQLKELDRLKAEFITTVTHELRTPITSIKSIGKILQSNPELSTNEQENFLNILVEESERIARLINQVLDLEKLQFNQHPVKMELLDFGEIARDAYDKCKHLMDQRGIVHFCQIKTGNYHVIGSRDHLFQAILNLLSNAIKFCDTDNGEVYIHLSEVGNQIMLKVRDNGKGIDEKDQAYIFEKFVQVTDQQQGKPKGTGLGLPITMEIIQQHKGKLWVESNTGEGAVFYITLPRKAG